jgi:hypothetical protein
MRLLVAAIVCIAILYAVDLHFFGGHYFAILRQMGRDVAHNF